MKIDYGQGPTEFGPGIDIQITGDEVATAIDAYLVSHGVVIQGARTVRVNGGLCEFGNVYVEPNGAVIYDGKMFLGRG